MSPRAKFSTEDEKWMKEALQLAERGAGYVSPNPMVGCVIVSEDGRLIGQGYHERYGEAHAEINALQSVKDRSNLVDATLYVTLEPCAHQGKTPPCSLELAKWPFKRIVVAMQDPTSKVNGKGIKHLRDHDIQVDVGLMEKEARKLNEFFLHFSTFKRPFVTLKIAQTVDGYIAAPDGESKWITGKEARHQVHRWRSVYDAVMIGRNTARLDNPRLTVRHVEGRQPYRIVVDGKYELPEALNLFTDQYEEKTIIVTHNREKVDDVADPMLSLLQTNYFRGRTVLVSENDGHSDLEDAFRKLGEMNITSVLVEGGRDLASALLAKRLVDKLEVFIAPKMLGGGIRSIIGLDINHMSDVQEFRDVSWQQFGKDMLLTAYF